MDVRTLLEVMVKQESSDLYLTVDAPPIYRIHGSTHRTDAPPFTNEQLESLALALMRGQQRGEFEEKMEMNLALYYKDLGRFRVNIFRQKGNVGLVFRLIKAEIQSVDQLQLPPIIKDIAMTKRGLVLVVGATGSGKSTSLAAMIDHRNTVHAGHIISVEDPIEFVHHHKKSIVTQREVGFDTHSFGNALKNTLRQAPDVILIGEIRDTETMEAAITFAETGHLCLSTLHANNTNQAIQRILNFFPEAAHRQVLMDLSLNLKGVVGQRLLRNSNGQLVPAVEVMLLSPYISELIQKGQTDDIKEAMAKSTELGMSTFDQSLYALYEAGELTAEQAVENADSRTDLSLRIRLHHGQRPNTSGLRVA